MDFPSDAAGAAETSATAAAPAPARPRLVVPYDISSSSPMSLVATLGDLCDVVWLADLADPSLARMGRLIGRLGEVVDTGGRPVEGLADLLVDQRVNGVVAFCDSQLDAAATIADALGLPGNPPGIVARLNDKYAQRRALLAAGLPSPRFVQVDAASTDDVLDLVDGFTFPLVVKPTHGESSRDVVRVADRTELAKVVADRSGAVIVEEFLADDADAVAEGLGRYVSVESVAQRGVVVPVAITGKFPLVDPFRETGNFMPHPLGADLAAEVLDLADAAAHALGVTSGVLHTEVKLTPDGPRIIEVNGRVGGGAIDLLHAQRFGVSLTELAARIALGIPVEVAADDPTPGSGPFLYQFFLQPPQGATTLTAFGGADDIREATGAEEVAANRSPGDALDWRDGSQGYVLRVGGTAEDLGAVVAIPDAVAAAAAITYD